MLFVGRYQGISLTINFDTIVMICEMFGIFYATFYTVSVKNGGFNKMIQKIIHFFQNLYHYFVESLFDVKYPKSYPDLDVTGGYLGIIDRPGSHRWIPQA